MKLAIISKDIIDQKHFARYLVLKHNFTNMSMMEGIRFIVRKLYFYKSKTPVRWETQFQFYDALYKIDHSIWTRYLGDRLKKTTKDIVVTEVRYSDEARALNEMGFILIRITSPEKGSVARVLAGKRRNQEPLEGTILLQEMYGKASPYKIAYTIYNDNKDKTAKTLDNIVDQERHKVL